MPIQSPGAGRAGPVCLALNPVRGCKLLLSSALLRGVDRPSDPPLRPQLLGGHRTDSPDQTPGGDGPRQPASRALVPPPRASGALPRSRNRPGQSRGLRHRPESDGTIGSNESGRHHHPPSGWAAPLSWKRRRAGPRHSSWMKRWPSPRASWHGRAAMDDVHQGLRFSSAGLQGAIVHRPGAGTGNSGRLPTHHPTMAGRPPCHFAPLLLQEDRLRSRSVSSHACLPTDL
jgi:hypothetical protein